jgi:poly-beta-1,6-N-acetyl-D-glucosamine synthase
MTNLSYKIAVIVPTSNEEDVIVETLQSIMKLVNGKDLYVIDDGSKDKTIQLSKLFTSNVLSIPHSGKAGALNFGIKYYNLTKKYDYILFMDADTQPSRNFLKFSLRHFRSDSNKDIIGIVGRVKGQGVNWISKYRQWEYQISHLIHKRAQSYLKSIVVLPGCATIYRSYIFDKFRFPKGTLTEDMDFTFMLHRSGYSNFVFEAKAIVYTQDPVNLKDYIRQLLRWYTGFWQNVRKHEIPWKGQMLDLEVVILAIEGLYNSLLVILLVTSLIPIVINNQISILGIPFLIDFFLFFLPTLIWSIISDRDYSRILLAPQFYLLRFLSSLIFLRSFFSGFLSLEMAYMWNTKRYRYSAKEATQ